MMMIQFYSTIGTYSPILTWEREKVRRRGFSGKTSSFAKRMKAFARGSIFVSIAALDFRGRVQDGCLICPYHGWNYDASGQCVRMPAHPSQPPPTRAHTYRDHITERYV